MRKVVVHRAGGWERLLVEEHPQPPVGPGEVRIRVGAAGVNFADCVVRMGLYQSARDYVGWPITPGFEVAGAVEAVGDGVESFQVGDEVIAVSRFGGYATELVVPAHQAVRRPTELTVEQAAAFPAVHLTAWYALFELAHPHAGDRALVHSAAGGVGTALLQLLRIAGAHPVGVVGGSHKVATARANGAEQVVDKSREALWAAAERHAPGGYDIVLDANGVETLAGSYGHLAPGGKLVVYGFHSMLVRGRGRPSWPKLALDWLRTPRFDPLRMTGDNRSVLAFNLSYLFDRTDLLSRALDRLLGWVAEGRLTPPPVRAVPFEDVARAHQALESGTTVGKLVLVP